MINAKLENVEKVKCTMTFTMDICEWREIRTTLSRNERYCELKIIRDIDSIIQKLEQAFYPEAEGE